MCRANPFAAIDIRTTESILNHIRSLGYKVSVHVMPSSLLGTVGPYVEMHALKLPDADEPFIARVSDGNGELEQYRCACLLAEMVGVEIGDE